MNGLSEGRAKEFVVWLEGAKHFLPPKMTVYDARLMFEQKLKEEEELKNAKSNPNGKPGAKGVSQMAKCPPNCS